MILRSGKTDLKFKINRKIEDNVCERTDQTEILSGIWSGTGSF